MGARRFFVADLHDIGDRLLIEGSDAHKILNVLRLGAGDSIEIADSGARLFRASLERDGPRVLARLTERIANAPASAAAIDVAQGVPKGTKMDFIVEKLTELGVREILPVESERSIPRAPAGSKLERWRRLARSASAQSGRVSIPEVSVPVAFDELLARFASYDTVIFPWELAPERPLREVLPPLVAGAASILVVVGPEGGFSHDEAERAAAAGATIVSLGEQILRTETAALVLLSVLCYLIM
jgi:16S rRNA (uracil1498-N3)-methyltransferase